MRDYEQYITAKQAQYGARFTDKDLVPQFRTYFESGQRIRAETLGQELTGTVGVTTGWSPAFLLMRTSRSMGSIYLLGHGDRVLAEQQANGKYTPIA